MVEVLDPMILASKVMDVYGCGDQNVVQVPDYIAALFDEPLVVAPGNRRLLVTLRQFSIVRLERDAQLIVPVLDYAMPTKECCDTPGACAEDPCEMFSRIPFPTQQFAPRGCDSPENDGCNS